MNRRWPEVASWALLGAATSAVFAEHHFTLPSSGMVWSLAGLGTLAQLCRRLHTQHAIAAGAVIMAIFASWLTASARYGLPSGPAGFTGALGDGIFGGMPLPAAFIGFVLLINSRSVARFLLRRRPGNTGLIVLPLTSGFLALAAGLMEEAVKHRAHWWRWSSGTTARFAPLIWAMVGTIALLAAMPWLIKVIPGSKDDDRQSIALWLLLILWFALKLPGAP